jgi:hypothetical protein
LYQHMKIVPINFSSEYKSFAWTLQMILETDS